MKKVLIGCGVVVLLMILAAFLGGVWVYRTGKKMAADLQADRMELLAVDREFPFTRPEDGKLTEAQLNKWLDVREASLAKETQIEEKFKAGIPTLVTQMPKLLPSLVQDTIKVLRQEKISPREYFWVMDQVMGALKSRAAAKDPELADLRETNERPARGVRFGRRFIRQTRTTQFAPLGPEEAKPILDLIRPQKERVRKVARFGVFDGMVYRLMQENARQMLAGRTPQSAAPAKPANPARADDVTTKPLEADESTTR